MHIIESTALTCGAKIDKPYIYKTFFPSPYEKYVIFAPQNKIPSRDYWYFQDVLNCIFPRLEELGIKILQIGPKDSINYNGVINLCGRITMSQMAYLIDKATLFLGVDGFEAHVASAANIPMVCINSSTYTNNTGPYFGDEDKQVLLQSYARVGNKKPSFNVNETPRSINLIKPEEIANAAFSLMGIVFKMPFETVFVGERYSHFIIQETLTNASNPLFNPENLVEIRADVNFNAEGFVKQLGYCKKSVIITDKPLDLNILKAFKQHIQAVVFIISKGINGAEFLSSVRALGLKIALLSEMSQEDIDKIKINYYEFGFINKWKEYTPDIINELKRDFDKIYYRSSKILSADGKIFYSLAGYEQGVSLNNNFEYQKAIDSPNFWKNLDFFTLVKILD